MFTTDQARPANVWLTRPLAAVGLSLTAVCFFVGLLGAVFLPRDPLWRKQANYVSVTQSLVTAAGRPAITVFWSIGMNSAPGARRYLAVHPPDIGRPPVAIHCQRLRPMVLAAGPDADHVLVGDLNGSIYSLDLRRPAAEPLRVCRQPDAGAVMLACTADGRCVLSQSAFQTYAWDLELGTLRWTRKDIAPHCVAPQPNSVSALASTLDGELVQIDLASGRTVRSLAHYEKPPLTISLSPDGRRLAVVKDYGSVHLLDAQTGDKRWSQKTELDWHDNVGRFVAFSPCGRFLATAGQQSGNAVTVWSVASGRPLMNFEGHRRAVLGAAFAADGTLRSWGADGTIRTWNLATGATLHVAALAPHDATS